MKDYITEDNYVDYESFILSDRDLHKKLVEIIDNNRLVNLYSSLNIHMQVARTHYLNTVESARQAQKEHKTISQAIHDRNLSELKKALSDHINTVMCRMLDLLDETGGHL